MYRVLIVEDDGDISNMLLDLLCGAGYAADRAFSGTEALLLLERGRYDLALLDLMLPGLSGEQVLCAIRAKCAMPVIITSARDDRVSKIDLLHMGADDYIVKPYDTEELLARIEAQLRRFSMQLAQKRLTYKDITLDPDAYTAAVAGCPVQLTKREYLILELLMGQPKRVFTKNNIYESVWGEEFFGDDNTVNVHISNLRAKLAKCKPDASYIETVWGIGFKMAGPDS